MKQRVIAPESAEICRRLAGKEYINVIGIIEITAENGVFTVTEEEFEGVTLSERLKNGVSAGELEDFIQQLCDALDFLAKQGIFHSAINAENILIGEDNALKLTRLDMTYLGDIEDNMENSLKRIGKLLKSTDYARKYAGVIRDCGSGFYESFSELSRDMSSRSFLGKHAAIIGILVISAFLVYRVFGRAIAPLFRSLY